MRFLIDANISYRLVAALRRSGHDVRSVTEENPNAADADILGWAVEDKRTILTYDKDFGELVFKLARRHAGVILLRCQDESYQTQFTVLKQFLTRHTPKEIQAHFWTLNENAERRARTFF